MVLLCTSSLGKTINSWAFKMVQRIKFLTQKDEDRLNSLIIHTNAGWAWEPVGVLVAIRYSSFTWIVEIGFWKSYLATLVIYISELSGFNWEVLPQWWRQRLVDKDLWSQSTCTFMCVCECMYIYIYWCTKHIHTYKKKKEITLSSCLYH